MDGTVTISKDEYFRLRRAEEKLRLLNWGGVDNWEWYDESLFPEGQASLDDIECTLKEEIERM